MFHVPTAMASVRNIHRWAVDNLLLTPTSSAIQTQPPKHVILPMPISRRCAILISVLPFSVISQPHSSDARERRTKKNIPLEDYLTSRELLIPSSLSLSLSLSLSPYIIFIWVFIFLWFFILGAGVFGVIFHLKLGLGKFGCMFHGVWFFGFMGFDFLP